MYKLFSYAKKIIIDNKYLVLILFLYFILRLINLTKPPLFNDESIYLDWGFRETHVPGFLYYSLYDAKQPFLMWIFGLSESVFSNPVFAGRIVSVFAGFISLIGIYKISMNLFSRNTALIASLFYCVIPLFSFYDRQALMESSVAAVGIWSGYFLIRFFEDRGYRYSMFLGITLGIGYFIKSTALVFFAVSVFLVLCSFFVNEKKTKVIQNLALLVGTFVLVIFFLIINPLFWDTFSTNSRFTLTLGELLSFPFAIWKQSIFTNLQIPFLYLTPFIFIPSLIGVGLVLKKKNTKNNIFLSFFLLSLVLETLLIRQSTDRYLVAFLPFLTIPIAYFVFTVLEKNKSFGIILFLISFLPPLFLTTLQVKNQADYLLFMENYAGYNISYLNGYTSGYGLDEAVDTIKELSKEKKIILGVAQNTGNPESAMLVLFAKDKNVRVAYLDASLFPINVNEYNCLKIPQETYFISRDNQQGGLEKFFQKIKTIKNSYGSNTIGVFKLKTNCEGKSFEVTLRQN